MDIDHVPDLPGGAVDLRAGQKEVHRKEVACQRALASPDSVRELRTFATSLAIQEDGSKVLILGLPTGEQFLVSFAAQNAAELGRALQLPGPAEAPADLN